MIPRVSCQSNTPAGVAIHNVLRFPALGFSLSLAEESMMMDDHLPLYPTKATMPSFFFVYVHHTPFAYVIRCSVVGVQKIWSICAMNYVTFYFVG